MAYELQLTHYSGPLEKLLELIEERKLEISEISLAQVTEDFLAYLREPREIETTVLADFILVASRLLYIKSKSLLPDLTLSEEEEEDIKDLELRLKLYREFRPAMKKVLGLWRSPKSTFGRAYLLGVLSGSESGGSGLFYPGNTLDLPSLSLALGTIFESFRSLELETKTVKRQIVTIEEKIQEVIERLTKEGSTSFNALSKTRSSSEIIALFLAILHLAREWNIHLEQEGHFSDILISKGRDKDSHA